MHMQLMHADACKDTFVHMDKAKAKKRPFEL